MVSTILKRVALAGTLVIGLAGCADGFGRRAYNSNYDRYYGNTQGYASVPYGYAGRNFGWSQGYYYPGTGAMVYNRRGVARPWSSSQRRYWERRVARSQRADGERGRKGRIRRE
jgi:hypothetical protein